MPESQPTCANLIRCWVAVARGAVPRFGAMPRCDFACIGCYLGTGANKTPPLSVKALKQQMRTMRDHLGNRGNLQLTDGEILLRPMDDVIELLRYARRIGLIPMIMTHGDPLRRRTGMLERLMEEGGLEEISIHIDATQRGRAGVYKHARTEVELMPLREEFAHLIRQARLTTRRPLRAASTMTVTAQNVGDVPIVIDGMQRQADVFRLLSLQPAAQVGRTHPGLGGAVSVEDLWNQIATGLVGEGRRRSEVAAGEWWMGHPGCNRIVTGLVSAQPGTPPAFHPFRLTGGGMGQRVVGWLVARFGRVTFRGDSIPQRIARLAGLFVRAPVFVVANGVQYAVHWLKRFDPHRPWRFAWHWIRRRSLVHQFSVMSHHFMSAEEISTQEGRARLSLCVFHVPVDGRMMPMCEGNALGARDAFYRTLRAASPTDAAAARRLVS